MSWPPLILDFHGAAAPSRKGANITRERVWAGFVENVPVLMLGLNARTRSWNSIKGKMDDTAYVARSELQKLDQIAWPQPGKTELVVDGVRISGIRRVDDVIYFTVGRPAK